MDREVAPDRVIAELAGRQHGVVSLAQLLELGIGDGAIRRRIRSGRLHPVHRGVFAVGHSALSPQGRCMAAVLAVSVPVTGGRRSVLERWRAAVSHRSAACLWNLLPWADPTVDVTVAGRTGRARRGGLRVHRPRSLGPFEVTLRAGIPVTSPARTLKDLNSAERRRAPGAISPWELRRAMRQAEVLGLPLGEEGRTDGTRSDLEAAFLRLCRRHRFPAPEVNVRVGPFLVDFLWREARLIVETDGYRYHRGRSAFREDHRRDLRLRRLGYEVVRVSEQQLEEDREEVALALAGSLRRGPGA